MGKQDVNCCCKARKCDIERNRRHVSLFYCTASSDTLRDFISVPVKLCKHRLKYISGHSLNTLNRSNSEIATIYIQGTYF